MKHNSPLQRHVFLPLTCRILKRNDIFSPVLSWLTKGTRNYKPSPEKYKDDLRWSRDTRNPYKCMNVMKQDAMDDKIKERCKTCEKQCMQVGLDRSRSCRASIERKPRILDGSRICRESIRQTESSKKIPRWIEKLSRICRDHKKKAQ